LSITFFANFESVGNVMFFSSTVGITVKKWGLINKLA
jgi:hypothetical protein